ncbi:conserved exported hypothetical protein [Thiocapsa sp. KS1]|nr:DUF1566 domain-containing protein [Thiocapsa sp. KS1]CRI67139.1 conserved exported hypothetical protein [Thiocapsa sp. KS1]
MRSVCLFLLVIAGSAEPVLAEQRCDTAAYPLSSPTERFADNGDGTVTDRQAQLTWMRCSAGQDWSEGTCAGPAAAYDWAAAQGVAAEMNASGRHFYNDWRVPTLRELAMITERQCENPRINLGVFPNTPAVVYWTESSRPGEDFVDFAYALSFGPEGALHLSKQEQHQVRLVRTSD